jgi:hypothetical protein
MEDAYEGMELSFFELLNIWLEHSPIYIISGGYLLITLALEVPFICMIISMIVSDGKKLLYSVITVNIITTLLCAIVERIMFRGSW